MRVAAPGPIAKLPKGMANPGGGSKKNKEAAEKDDAKGDKGLPTDLAELIGAAGIQLMIKKAGDDEPEQESAGAKAKTKSFNVSHLLR